MSAPGTSATAPGATATSGTGDGLEGLRVIVTGASSGLGAHVVRHLAGLGARVVAVARRRDRLDRLAEELADAPGRVVPFVADVTADADARAMVAAAVDAFGGLDVLVNNAGSEVQAPIDRLTEADLEGMWRANVLSVFLCTRAALDELRKSRGVVVNLGSTAVTRPPRGRFGYVSSKGAVEAMTRALAVDLGRDGIRVNVIRPGIIPSELRGLTEDEERSRFEAGTVFGRQALSTVGEGRDVAQAIAWLCGPGGRFVTGTVIDVDAGYTLGIVDAP
jgi:NAD(P)-dependent dehydrogenase (short-subunit alcohol dehydrogenase family)